VSRNDSAKCKLGLHSAPKHLSLAGTGYRLALNPRGIVRSLIE
jgi:hypothetical protein